MLERIVARLRAHSIDDRLLAGELPEGSAETRARCTRLLDRTYRSAVADHLRKLVEDAERAERNRLRAQIPLRETEVTGARSLVLGLADEVEGDPSVHPRGVILADRLIRDGDSPVYWPCDESVVRAVKHARAALHLG